VALSDRRLTQRHPAAVELGVDAGDAGDGSLDASLAAAVGAMPTSEELTLPFG